MAEVFKNLFGGSKPSAAPNEDADFADFAGAPDPSPASISPVPVASSLGSLPTGTGGPVVYTKWYRVWERTKPSDFLAEAIITPFLILAVLVHLWGTRKNKNKAKKWIKAHKPALDAEYAHVGFDRPTSAGGLNANELDPTAVLKEKTAQEFSTYATGRQNVAFLDVKLNLLKRYNPLILGPELLLSSLFDSVSAPVERLDAVAYVFDGRERDFVPAPAGDTELIDRAKGGNSTFDGFVWAIVNKNRMRKLRDERYDASLTYTKDHSKLPNWVTVMSESAEVTEMMLTSELIKAVEQAGDVFEYLLVTDQPIDKPMKLDETTPKKRVHLSLRLPSNDDYTASLPIFSAFLRLPDHLVSQAHFRPEVMRKIRTVREEEIKKLKRVDETEAEEERKKQTEKLKKEERDRKMRGMTAEEQRKFLDKEEKQKRKKSEKKMTRRG